MPKRKPVPRVSTSNLVRGRLACPLTSRGPDLGSRFRKKFRVIGCRHDTPPSLQGVILAPRGSRSNPGQPTTKRLASELGARHLQAARGVRVAPSHPTCPLSRQPPY